MSVGRPELTFVEAKRRVASFPGGEPLSFLFGASGTTEPFTLFLKAAGAARGRTVIVRSLPFNTLGQFLREPVPSTGPDREVFLLTPWDFIPELDWRSGLPVEVPDEPRIRERAVATVDLLARRPSMQALFLPAPIPPLWSDERRNQSLRAWLESLALGLGARVLSPDAFALGSYFATGCPVNGTWIGRVAEAVVEAAQVTPSESAKVLVTDLDNVLWSGVIADDTLDGIACSPEGAGYRHYVYQTCVARLRREGVLIAAVTRNPPDLVREALQSGRMPLVEDDFIAILAGYSAKSTRLSALAANLNLGLDAFVFVDDNPVELAEVSLALPGVRTLAFPLRDDELPGFLDRLTALFPRRVVTVEDTRRTELYRRRLAGVVPADTQGAELTSFLRDLEMRLTVRDRSSGDRTRVVQLINKTNQFNLNGRRFTDAEIEQVLRDGGRLYGASLQDRTGDHGEILACLVASDGTVLSLVLSCRVFQRRVEFAFLAWLGRQADAPRRFAYAPTSRNEPVRNFLTEVGAVDFSTFPQRYRADLELFDISDVCRV